MKMRPNLLEYLALAEDFDDIPLAKRVSPLKILNLKRLSSVFGLIFFVVVTSTLLVSNVFFESWRPSDNEIVESPRLDNGRLLGHYPYPEALSKDLVSFQSGISVHRDIYLTFIEMKRQAALEGISLILLSGYRSIALQKEIFYENKSLRNQTALERARVSAPPGYSEHSTGYAIDVGDGRRPETHFEVEFEETSAFKWMKRNAAKFHFILSFPKGNNQGVSYEPWHWRYEGTVEALRQFEPANQNRGFK